MRTLCQRSLAFILYGAIGCGISEEEAKREFQDVVSASNQCERASDCVLVSPGCPLGCRVFVNRSRVGYVERRAREIIDDYQSGGVACDYGCISPEDPVCVEARCMGETPTAMPNDAGTSHDAAAH